VRLTTDVISYTVHHIPKWNPTNVCSYHLQEAGATPTQELAYALSTAIAILDAIRDAGRLDGDAFANVVGRTSFFVNAGIRFVEECCKMRAFVEMWDRIARERYGVEDPKLRRFRYGVQVNSLGLTEAQPENNVQRIVLEMLAVTLSRKARARAVQLPAWNEALGLPRPWDQQWALRMQQVLALETDLLEYGDIFDGSPIIDSKVRDLVLGAEAEMQRVQEEGGMVHAVETGYVKRQLVASHTARMRAIEADDLKIIGVNCFTETAESPLTSGTDSGIMKVDAASELDQVERLKAFRDSRNPAEAKAALNQLGEAARSGENIMPASIRCAHAGVTTGEWSNELRTIFGEYRAPTGIDISAHSLGRSDVVETLRQRTRKTGEELGRPLRILVGKPGLDGHSNGAEQIAVKARDVGFEVVYEGIRLTPEQIVKAAEEEGVHLIGLSVLSGSHLELVEDALGRLADLGLSEVPVIVGGIVPLEDEQDLLAQGVAAVYTPKDSDMNKIMSDLVNIIRENNGLKRFEDAA
jgi:(2R)-ethylmalonyl-CoA mutase